MDTTTIVCLGIAATISAVSILCTLRILSQVSEDDTNLKQLMQKRNKKDE
jgi:hypothetical protein